MSTKAVLHCRVVEARDLAAADPNGYSDPYVKIKLHDGAKEKSHTLQKTLHPVWNWDASFSVSDWSTNLSLEVVDEDEVLSNDPLGFLKLKLSDLLHKRVSGGWYRLRDSKGEKLAHGRVFIVFAVDTTAKGPRSAFERASILLHATERVVQQSNAADGLSGAMSNMALASSQAPSSNPQACPVVSQSPAVINYAATSASSSSASAPNSGGLPVQSHIKLFVGSWNVGNAPPSEDLSSWLQKGHDLYSIGVQECKYDVPGAMLQKISSVVQCGNHFGDLLAKNLGDQFVLVKREDMMELRHYIFARRELRDRIDAVTASCEATGLGGIVGNKGGCAISFDIDDASFAFVTSHLAAHQDKSQRRNDDVRDILASLKLNRRNVDVLHAFRYLFWSGDLNYRLNWGSQGDAHSPSPEQFAAFCAKIDSGARTDLQELFATDQLAAAMREGRVFRGGNWIEGDCTGFAPTFKVARQVGTVYKDQRSPAWCDRVLWRVGQIAAVDESRSTDPAQEVAQARALRAQFAPQLTAFSSAPDVATSDHKPVWATFSVPILRLPLSTDFRLGSLRVRFLSLSIEGLSSYATPSPRDPLVKFHGNFLASVAETKSASSVVGAAAGAGQVASTPISASASAASSPAASSVSTPTYHWSESDLPLLHSQCNNPAKLRLQPLLLKVLTYTFEGSKIEKLVATAEVDLGRGAHGKPTEFRAELTYGGLAAGSISGRFVLDWQTHAIWGNQAPMSAEQVAAL